METVSNQGISIADAVYMCFIRGFGKYWIMRGCMRVLSLGNGRTHTLSTETGFGLPAITKSLLATLLMAFALLVVLPATPAGADPAAQFNDGLKAYEAGDYQTALEKWRPLAESGVPAAQYNMAVLYANGAGVDRDFAQSAAWYRMAAEAGHSKAQFRLGNTYYDGRGVPQDYGAAASWYRRAAINGITGAQERLSEMYASGTGVPLNEAEAKSWKETGAGVGDPCGGWLTYDDDASEAFWKNADAELVEHCLEQGRHAFSASGSTRVYPLYQAARWSQDARVLNLLVNRGASIIVDGDNGFNILFAASYNLNPSIHEWLIEIGADVNSQSPHGHGSAFATAAWRNPNPAVLELMISHGADVNARDDDGDTPLHGAAKRNANPDILELLISHGSSIDPRNEDGYTPLHMAVAWNVKSPRILEIVEVLVRHGANIEAKGENQYRPLHMAATFNNANPEILELLVRHGADIEALSGFGGTPLLHASGNSNPAMVETLLRLGANVDVRFDDAGWTALHVAASRDSTSPKTIELLLDAGVDPSIKDTKGRTPFEVIGEDSELRGTDVYWRLNEARFD